jgi:hypothetical protein
MNRSSFASALRRTTVAALACAVIAGTLGISSIASAEETAKPAAPPPSWTMNGPGFTLGSAGLSLLGPSLNVITPPPPAPPPPPPPPAEPTPLAKIFLNLPGVVVQAPPQQPRAPQ